jgi:hypothetical protein
MREAQHEAWKRNEPNPHLLGLKEYEALVKGISERL